MENRREKQPNTKNITLMFEHNPYETNIYAPKKSADKAIVFPTFNYQGDKQYIDLIRALVDRGYKVVTIKLLNFGDRVLFFNYYFTVFTNLLDDIIARKIVNKEQIVLLGYGVSANLVAYTHSRLSDNIKIERIVLISPVNKYKSEYRISKEIASFKVPTYVFYGEFDKINSVSDRFALYETGKDNPNVHFACYAYTGYYLYYEGTLSMEMSKLYRNNNYDLLVGESKKNKNPFLPSELSYNELFFKHLTNFLQGKDNPKRIALITDTCPLLSNGAEDSLELLKKELDKLGYETYIVSLWKKYQEFNLLTGPTYVPVIARQVNIGSDILVLAANHIKENAKMLAIFGFDYLHLHTEYSMSSIALELSKITGKKMVYTHHPLRQYYYDHNEGKLSKDSDIKSALSLCKNKLVKECPTLVFPSKKSYEVVKSKKHIPDGRIMPSAINVEEFGLDKEDHLLVRKLKNKYKLDDRKVLGYVGRVVVERNLVDILRYLSRMVKEIPNVVLMIVGLQDAESALSKMVKKLHLENYVIFVGPVEKSVLKFYYSLFDVMVIASSFDHLSCSYLMASLCGCPILAKEDEAIEGVYKDGENAYVYKDFYQWAERLEKALFYNNHQIVDNGKVLMKKYDSKLWAKKYLEIYTELNK